MPSLRRVDPTVPLTLVYGDSKDDDSDTPCLGAIRKGQAGKSL